MSFGWCCTNLLWEKTQSDLIISIQDQMGSIWHFTTEEWRISMRMKPARCGESRPHSCTGQSTELRRSILAQARVAAKGFPPSDAGIERDVQSQPTAGTVHERNRRRSLQTVRLTARALLPPDFPLRVTTGSNVTMLPSSVRRVIATVPSSPIIASLASSAPRVAAVASASFSRAIKTNGHQRRYSSSKPSNPNDGPRDYNSRPAVPAGSSKSSGEKRKRKAKEAPMPQLPSVPSTGHITDSGGFLPYISCVAFSHSV